MQAIIPHLFHTEFRKLVSLIAKRFGLEHIAIAEDIVSDTFLLATETWGKKGIPDNPSAWLYTVAQNRTKDYLRRNTLFTQKIAHTIKSSTQEVIEAEFDVSLQHIKNSELQMLFALCHPAIPIESQIGLSLRILFGLGIEEIADAFLSNKETINKRLFRAKEKLREEKIAMEMPGEDEIGKRLEAVVSCIYLLFNEGYYSASQNSVLRKDICQQALYLAYLLSENEQTNTPSVNALIALICFHASRFEARTQNGAFVLLEEQDQGLWDQALIAMGELYLNRSASGDKLSKYHLEAAIAYWHTRPVDDTEKWRQILNYYNILLQIEYSPMTALNRTYALAKAESVEKAIHEALKLKLEHHHLYFALLGQLYTGYDKVQALEYFDKALTKAKTESDKKIIASKIAKLKMG